MLQVHNAKSERRNIGKKFWARQMTLVVVSFILLFFTMCKSSFMLLIWFSQIIVFGEIIIRSGLQKFCPGKRPILNIENPLA